MIKVNLLSPEKKEISGAAPEGASFPEEVKESKISKGSIIGAVVITLGIIGGLWFMQTQTLAEREQRLQERRARKTALDGVLKKLDELEKAKQMLERKVKLISDLKSSQQDVVKMMDALCDALPDWVWITDLRYNNRRVNISGKAIHNNLISDFINNLKGTGHFDDIQFPGSDRKKQAGQDIFDFKLNCRYKEKDTETKDKNTTTQNKAG